MNFRDFIIFSLWLACSAIPYTTNAQSDQALLKDLAEENKKSIEALVLYPP